MFLQAGAGMLLGFFTWIGYSQLSIIDPFPTLHLNGLVVFILAGAWIYRTRARAIMWAIPAGLAFMIMLISFSPIVLAPAHAMIRTDSLRLVDAVVVLSSGVSDDEVLDQQGLDRLLTGLEITRSVGARALVVTPLALEGSEGTVHSKYDQRRLYHLAGSPVEMITTGPVGNTHGEALETQRLAKERGWSRVAVVTSPLHSRRACATFEKAGLAVVCVPALSRDVAVGTLKGGGDRLRAFQLWLYESLAISEYRRRGWI